MEVSTKLLAEILGVESRYLQQLEKRNILEKISTGKWDLAKNVQIYVRHQRDNIKNEYERRMKAIADAGSENDPDYRLKMAKARITELELEKEMGTIVYTDDVIQYMQNLAQAILNAHEKLPKKVGKGIEDINVRRSVQNEVKTLLISLFAEIRNANITTNIPVDFSDTKEKYQED